MSSGQWERMRRSLLMILQDKHTRVSLLLQANFQGQDGRARLVREGPVARGSRVPGTITLFEHGAERSHAVVATKFEQAEERPLNYSAHHL